MNEFDKKTNLSDQLAAARFVLAASGKSPKSIAIESRNKVLDWIYKFGYTSSSIGQLLLSKTSGGYLKKIADQGFLKSIKTESGIPHSIFTLTESGLEEAERHSSFLNNYVEVDSYKVNQRTIRHNLITQLSTLKALESGAIVDYETEKMLSNEGDKLGVKRPDVLWITDSGVRIAVEVELTAKWERKLDDFILKVYRALKQKDDGTSEYDSFIIITDSEAIIERYKKAFQSASNFHVWKKNDSKRWVKGSTYKIPEWLAKKVDFQLIGG